MSEIKLLKDVQQRIDEVYKELQEKEEFMRSDRSLEDPDEFAAAENAANILEGRLKELYWIKKAIYGSDEV